MLKDFLNCLSDLIIVAKKELLHCSRDGHVIVYSVVIPVIFYPVIFIGASEFALWRQGLSEKSPIRIAATKNSIEALPELIKEIKETKSTKLLKVEQPLAQLKAQKLECFISVDKSGKITTAYLNPSSDRHVETSVQLRFIAAQAQSRASQKELKRLGLTGDILNVFKIETESVDSLTGKGKSMKDMEDTMLATSLIAAGIAIYTLMVVQAGAIYPALTAFTEELEKKTRSTTRLLPIAKWIVIAGKFISVFMVATFSGLLNIASLALVIIYLMNRLPVDNISVFPSTDDLNLFKCAILLMLYLISVAFISSIYCLVGSMARSFKEAQNTSSFVMVLTMAIPVIAIMPGWSLNSATALVPILNVVLACKQLLGNTLMPLPLFLICSQMLLFAGLLLYFSQLAFWGSEPGIGARRARKSRQIS